MYIVTGGAGFIGSNIVQELNKLGHTDILVVDDLTDGHKFVNLADLQIADYMDKAVFLEQLRSNANFAKPIKAVFHEGACSTTTEWNGKFMMENNYEYSKVVLHYCLDRQIPLSYASSAATYGGSSEFKETPEYELPLNVYGYSKLLFDQYVRRILPSAKSQVIGFRYFNVYGPREGHKGSMASVAFHLHNQLQDTGKVKLFAGCDGYADGEQRRDFIFVEDVVAVKLWAIQAGVSGIYNLGTGRSEPFNAIADAVLSWHKCGELEYVPFPAHLQGAYQSFTQADMTALRQAGCQHQFKTVAEGVAKYLDWLNG